MALNVEFDGRSKRVPVTPGTTMFQVLEAACSKFGLSRPPSSYQLTHRRQPIDMSIPFRLTGISNNATLELKESTNNKGNTASNTTIRVAVQLLTGQRVQSSFSSNTTISYILSTLEIPASSKSNFALGFLHQEISPENFETTTLKDLGLLQGSAMFRMKSIERELYAPAVPTASARSPPPGPASPDAKQSSEADEKAVKFAREDQTIGTSAGVEIKSAPPLPASLDSKPVVEDEKKAVQFASTEQTIGTSAGVELESSSPTEPPYEIDEPMDKEMSSYDALQLIRDSQFDASSKRSVLTLSKIVANILSYPDNEKMRSIRLTNKAFRRDVRDVKGGLEFLCTLGFAINRQTEKIELLELSPQVVEKLQEGFKWLQDEADDLGIDAGDRPEVVKPAEGDPNFDVFHSQITRFQMQPRGPSATEAQLEELKSKQEKLIPSDLPPRNTMVFLDGVPHSSASSFMENEAQGSDSQLLVSSLKHKQSELEKANKFQTKAMRELDELKRKKVYQKTLIRIQFPDRVILQAYFHPNEKVADVEAFVKESLAPSAQYAFYLYVTPPRQRLDSAKSLSDLQLVPAAHTYLSWHDSPPTSSSDLPGSYLLPELTTTEEADAKSSTADVVAYPTSVPLTQEEKAEAKKETKSESKASSKSKSGKKPGWLKL